MALQRIITNLESWLPDAIKNSPVWSQYQQHWMAYSLLGVASISALRHVTKHWGLPPGPWGLPFVGALFRLSATNSHEELMQMIPRYGEVMSMYFGTKLVLILSSYDAIKEAYLKQNMIFAGRPDDPLFEDIGLKEPLFHHTYSAQWAKDKKKALSNLRSLGYGQASQENQVQEEADFLVRLLQENRDKKGEVVFDGHVLDAMCNVMLRVLVSKRYETDVKERDEFISNVEQFNVDVIRGMTAFLIPFGNYIFRKDIASAKVCADNMQDWMAKRIDEHKETFDPDTPRDFLDLYLSDDDTGLSDDELKALLCMLIPDSVGTLPTMFNWLLLHMALNQDVQKKVHEELDAVTGRSRPPNLDDKPNLPYIEATIAESLRCTSLFQLSPARATMKETTLMGYRIPKGCIVIPNFYAVNRDPKLWKSPKTFDPEHFLNEEGQFNRSKPFLYFSLGRRSCIGEPLARLELFMFFTTIMHHFKIEFRGDRTTLPTPEMDPGVSRCSGVSLAFTDRK